MTLGLIPGLGMWELILILLIVILLFGAKRIPDLARGLGQGIRNFRSGMRDESENDDPDKTTTDSSGS